MSLKIVHIITSLQRGGAEIALANLLAELGKQTDYQHMVIFFHDGPVRAIIENLGIRCYQVVAKGSYANPWFFFRLFKMVKELSPHCLHTDLWAANLLGRLCAYLLQVPCISVLHALTEHEGRIRTCIDRLVPVQATRYVAVSQSVYQSMLTYGRYAQSSRMVIANGIDHKAVLKSGRHCIPATVIKTGEKCFVIGTVGRLIPDKNYHVLLESFAHLYLRYPRVRLIIVGSGPEEKKLKLLAEKLHITNQITWIIGQQAYPYYSSFDCFVQPSRYEGLSIALLEALCFSLPVVVTGKELLHEVIEHQKNGLIIEPNQADTLTTHIAMLIENKTFCGTLGKAGFATVTQKFSLKSTAQHYHKLFEQSVFK